MDPSYINPIIEQLLPKIEEFQTRRSNKIHLLVLFDQIRFETWENEFQKRVCLPYKINGMKEGSGIELVNQRLLSID